MCAALFVSQHHDHRDGGAGVRRRGQLHRAPCTGEQHDFGGDIRRFNMPGTEPLRAGGARGNGLFTGPRRRGYAVPADQGDGHTRGAVLHVRARRVPRVTGCQDASVDIHARWRS